MILTVVKSSSSIRLYKNHLRMHEIKKSGEEKTYNFMSRLYEDGQEVDLELYMETYLRVKTALRAPEMLVELLSIRRTD